jgi:phosphoribosylanthranilate isomerase
MKIKVCGMRDANNIKELITLEPDYVGFIFHPASPRYVGADFSTEVTALVTKAKKVGVFVDCDFDDMREIIHHHKLDAVQLHGNETPGECWLHRSLGLTVIKAFPIDASFDFTTLEPYQEAVDYFLFDTKTPKHGGSGQKFDWEILKRYNNAKPIFLSGGIDVDDVTAIKALTHLNIHAVDVNSRFEKTPAVKDIEKLKRFMIELKQL